MASEIMNFRHNSKLADDEPKWGEVDKKELPRLAFADEGEEDEVSTWGYPHHWVKGGTEKDDNGRWKDGTLYLHEGGLDAAWAAANGARSGKEASEAVKKHLEAHRKAIGKDDSKNTLRGYDIRNQTAQTMDLYIYEEIGYEDWDGNGITAKRIASDLQSCGPDLKNITVHINSPGGRSFEGIAIYNLLKQHPAHVDVNIEGVAASAASIVAMAGNVISMANNALLMIHKPWSFAIGDAHAMRKEAELLDQVEASLLRTYLNQCAKSGKKDMSDKISALIDAESWLTAEASLELGLIDAVGDELPAAATASFNFDKFGYKNLPQSLVGKKPGNRAAPAQAQPVVIHNHITIQQPEPAAPKQEAPKPQGTPRLSMAMARLKLAEIQAARSQV